MPWTFSATTVTENAWPAVAVAGAVTFRSLTICEVKKPVRMFAVVCWILASVGVLRPKLSSAPPHDEVPAAKTKAPLGAW